MNPVPVAAGAAPNATEVSAIGLSRAWFIRNAGVVALHPPLPRYAGAGSTQKMSDHVRSPLFLSAVLAAGVLVNEESLRIPHDARMVGLNATRTLCVTSRTESTTPAAPQNTSKSAARTTLEVIASKFRLGTFGTLL